MQAIAWQSAPGAATNVHVRAALAALDCATATVRCVPSEHATIDACADAAAAGDICLVTAGTYVETVSLGVSGTSGNTITILASGTVTTCGLTFASKSYIRIIGLTLDPSTSGCANSIVVSATGTNTGLEFWNLTIQNNNGKAYNIDRGSGANVCHKCIFLGGSITNIGDPTSLVAMLIGGDNTFIGYIDFSDICYVGIGPSGTGQRIVNNYFHGLIQCGGSHPDFLYIASDALGWSNTLVESTFGIGTPTANNNKFHHQQNEGSVAWADNVYRRNVGHNIGSGVYSLYSTSANNLRTRFYHNTFVLNDRAVSGTAACGAGGAQGVGTTTSVYLTNELYQECWSADVTSGISGFTFGAGSGTSSITQDYNLAYDPDGAVTFSAAWNAQAHEQSNQDPGLTNVAIDDFHLAAASGGAYGNGGPLTTTSGSGTGTTFNTVANGAANFFGLNATLDQYGGNLATPDTITVGTDTCTVQSISGDAITCAETFTWADAESVYLGTDTTPDIGAFPYKAGGYALTATYSISGGIATIVPNDTTLVRIVVCYNSGMPIVVDNTSPYTCSVGSGAFSARVYPLYASTTLYAQAAP